MEASVCERLRDSVPNESMRRSPSTDKRPVLILNGSVGPTLLLEEEQLQGVQDERLPLRWYREVVDVRDERDLLRRLSF